MFLSSNSNIKIIKLNIIPNPIINNTVRNTIKLMFRRTHTRRPTEAYNGYYI